MSKHRALRLTTDIRWDVVMDGSVTVEEDASALALVVRADEGRALAQSHHTKHDHAHGQRVSRASETHTRRGNLGCKSDERPQSFETWSYDACSVQDHRGRRSAKKLRNAVFLTDRNQSVVNVGRSIIAISTGASRPLHVPFPAMASMAFSSIQRRADVAKAFQFDPNTVTRIRSLIAHCGMLCDAEFCKAINEHFKSKSSPTAFVSSIAADATSERLVLPFMGLDSLSEMGKSSWHVLVSGQRFVWSERSDEGALGWFVWEVVRPNVPLVSTESADTLINGLYSLPQVAAFAAFELNGLRVATFPFMHFDLDGHSSNAVMVAKRRRAVTNATERTPMVFLSALW